MLMTSSPLPPVTPRLRRGVGVGTRRAYEAKPGAMIEYGDRRKRPERESVERFRGPLTDGVEGVLAHHWHLADAGEADWAAWPCTLVYAELPAAARWVGTAVANRARPVVAGATLTLGRAKDPVVPVASTRVEHDGFTWTFTPAVEPAVADALAGALAGAPQGLVVEIEHGALCVFVDRELAEPGELWLVASAIAAAFARLPLQALDPAAPAAPPTMTERRRWVVDGAARLDWTAPPASVDEAVAAYTRIARGRRLGWAVGAAFFVVAAALCGAALWVGVATGLAVGGVITGAFALWLLARIAHAAVGTGLEIGRDERAARARPWGFEAFVQGYAASRGLVVEDPAIVQRGFDSPVRGRAVAAFHGPAGHLVLWRAPDGERWVVRVGDQVEAMRADWTATALDAIRLG